jgi:hypothetical protein
MTQFSQTPSGDHDGGDASGAGESRPRRRTRLVAGSTLGLAGVGAALVLALGGSTAAPAFAVTRSDSGSVLVNMSYGSGQNLPQVNAKLASMGLKEGITIDMKSGAASTPGAVTCAQGPGATTPIKVLVGSNGTEVIKAGESAGNTAQGTFHLDHCVAIGDGAAGNSGNSGNG